MSSKDDLTRLRPSLLPPALEIAFEHKLVPFIWGPPGIGKSQLVHQLGAKQGRPVIDVRLALYEPTDIRGIPYFSASTGEMCWAPPADLPREDGPLKNAILFLDEMNSAMPSVQAASYQLVLDRKIGQYQLPGEVSVVAAGNRDTDRGVTFKMPTPLRNRLIHLEVEHSFDDWFAWAIDHSVRPEILGFLSNNKQYLFTFESGINDRAFATPRSWEFVNRLYDRDVSPVVMESLVGGAVGLPVARQFIAHCEYSVKLPSPSDILDGKIKKMEKTDNVSACYTVVVGLYYELCQRYKRWVNEDSAYHKNETLTDSQFYEGFNNMINFVMDSFGEDGSINRPELVVLAVKMSFQLKAVDGDSLESYDRFVKKYGHYFRD